MKNKKLWKKLLATGICSITVLSTSGVITNMPITVLANKGANPVEEPKILETKKESTKNSDEQVLKGKEVSEKQTYEKKETKVKNCITENDDSKVVEGSEIKPEEEKVPEVKKEEVKTTEVKKEEVKTPEVKVEEAEVQEEKVPEVKEEAEAPEVVAPEVKEEVVTPEVKESVKPTLATTEATWNGKGDVVFKLNKGTAEKIEATGFNGQITDNVTDESEVFHVESGVNVKGDTLIISEAALREAIAQVNAYDINTDSSVLAGTAFVIVTESDNVVELGLNFTVNINIDEQKPVEPEKPEKPEPDKPVVPEPDKPVVPEPDKPVTPEVPDKPVTPEVPETPDKPVTPEVPETPDKPVTPDKPATPDNNTVQKPDTNKPVSGQVVKPSTNTQKPAEQKKAVEQTNNAVKTGDVANVLGLASTSISSLGVALLAMKRKFRK